jgi:hypothetical protein
MIIKQKNTINVQTDISFTVNYRFNCKDNIIFVQNMTELWQKNKTPHFPNEIHCELTDTSVR